MLSNWMRILLWVGCILFSVFPALAQPQAEVLLLPVELPGYYSPMQSDRLTARLEKRLQQIARSAEIQMARRADLTAYQYTAGNNQPPGPKLAEQLCLAYKANYVCWTSIRFQPNYDAGSQSLAMAGASRVWIYSQKDARVVIDDALSLVRNGKVPNIKDAEKSKKIALDLASGCVDDLGMQLVYLARERKSQLENRSQMAAWQPSQAQSSAQFSQNYRDMLKAIQSYQHATDSQDLINVTQAQQSMTNLWSRLNQAEQSAVTQAYPGIARMLNAPPIYGWPYYY